MGVGLLGWACSFFCHEIPLLRVAVISASEPHIPVPHWSGKENWAGILAAVNQGSWREISSFTPANLWLILLSALLDLLLDEPTEINFSHLTSCGFLVVMGTQGFVGRLCWINSKPLLFLELCLALLSCFQLPVQLLHSVLPFTGDARADYICCLCPFATFLMPGISSWHRVKRPLFSYHPLWNSLPAQHPLDELIQGKKIAQYWPWLSLGTMDLILGIFFF